MSQPGTHHLVTTVGPHAREMVRKTVWCTHHERTVWAGQCADCDKASESASVASRSSARFNPEVPVHALMQRDVFCVRTDVSMDELVAFLVEHGFSGAPIVDAEGRPAGVVSATDLLRQRYEQMEDEEAGMGQGLNRRPLVGDVMTPAPVVVPETMSWVEASRLMAAKRIHRLPVVNAEGILVGVLSSMDVVRWVGQQGL